MRVGSRSADRTTPALFCGRRAPREDVASQSLRGARTVSCACGRIGYRTVRGGTATRARVLRALLQAHPGAPVGGENADDDMSERTDCRYSVS
jgi:hypothetical protein